MKRAYFKYDNVLLGTLIYNEELKVGDFFYTVCSTDVDALVGIRPSILMELLESVRRDVKEPSFDYETYIGKYDVKGLHFEEEDK